MALQKQEISVNLVKGADNKDNDQINTNFNDMVNVVFTGDTTAKKMKGYTKIFDLPVNTVWSHLAKRDKDLIAINNQGFYKSIAGNTTLQKIDEIGALSIQQESLDYDYLALGTSQRCLIKTKAVKTLQAQTGVQQILTDPGYDITIQDLNGNTLYTTSINLTGTFYYTSGSTNYADLYTVDLTNQVGKLLAIGNDFYFFGASLISAAQGLYPTDSIYKINTSGAASITNFYFANPVGPYVSASTVLTTTQQAMCDYLVDGIVTYGPISQGVYTGAMNYNLDMITDGTNIYLVIVKTGISEDLSHGNGDTAIGIYFNGWKIDPTTGIKSYFKPYNGSTNPRPSNAQILNLPNDPVVTSSSLGISVNTLRTIWALDSSTFDAPPSYQNTAYCTIIDKATMTTVVANSPFATAYLDAETYNPYPSFVSCAWDLVNLRIKIAFFQKIFTPGVIIGVSEPWSAYAESLGPNRGKVLGMVGKSKPFVMDGVWYIAGKLAMPERYCSVIVKLADFTPQANFLNGQYSYFFGQYAPPYQEARSFAEVYNYNAENYILSSADQAGIVRIGMSSPQRISSLELNKRLITQASLHGLFDGSDYSEMGFIGSPYINSLNATSGGSLPADIYQIIAYYSWTDATGEEWRSGVSNIASTTTAIAANSKLDIYIYNPILTTKTNVKVRVFLRNSVIKFLEVANYNLKNTATMTHSDFIATPSFAKNISVSVMPNTAGAKPAIAKNKKITNALPDYVSTLAYTEQESSNDMATSVKCSTLHGDRIFYFSTEDDKKLFYSKIKTPGVGFEFPQLFYKQIIDKTGVLEDQGTALKSMDGRLIIFKERSILYMAGEGPANDGSNDDFSDPQLITTDVGCIDQRSLVLAPMGIMFKSDKGIYLLDRKLQVSYIGAPVEQFNGNTITSAFLLENVNEIRFSSLEGTTIVFNYYSKAWSWFENMPLLSATILNGRYTGLLNNRVIQEDPTTNKLENAFISQKISTPWSRLGGIQGYQKAYALYILGLYKTPHQIKVSVYYDYEIYASEVYTLDPLASSQYNLASRPTNNDIESGAKINGVYQLKIDLIRKNCEAVKFVIEDLSTTFGTDSGECFALTNLSLTIGVKQGANKMPAQKQY